MKISTVKARQILDSRGTPTIEVDVILANGIMGRASAPSGASVGIKEALELRDKNSTTFNGKGVLGAVSNVNTIIAAALCNQDPSLQSKIDSILIELDGTTNKGKLGANAIIATSIAVLKAAAACSNKQLFEYLGAEHKLPVPLMNILNGGAHANNGLDIQEFMIVPVGATTFAQSLQMGSEIISTLKNLLDKKGFSTAVGDEGGFAPKLRNHREAMELIISSVTSAGYVYGRDVRLALDVAASELYRNNMYHLKSENSIYTPEQMAQYCQSLVVDYDVASIEDGMAEDDIAGWQVLTKNLKDRVQVIGDDVFVTNVEVLKELASQGIANAILIKPNQIGTITETMETVQYAKGLGYNCIMSHRSGETEDSSIAHLAVGMGCSQIKTGSLCRGERTAKYNELLRIEEYLGPQAKYDANVFNKKLTAVS